MRQDFWYSSYSALEFCLTIYLICLYHNKIRYANQYRQYLLPPLPMPLLQAAIRRRVPSSRQ